MTRVASSATPGPERNEGPDSAFVGVFRPPTRGRGRNEGPDSAFVGFFSPPLVDGGGGGGADGDDFPLGGGVGGVGEEDVVLAVAAAVDPLLVFRVRRQRAQDALGRPDRRV